MTMIKPGVTERMLAKALEQAKRRKPVCVITATQQDADRLEKMCGEEGYVAGIQFKCLDSLENFDWKTRQFRHDRQRLVYIDHLAFDRKFLRHTFLTIYKP